LAARVRSFEKTKRAGVEQAEGGEEEVLLRSR
jgi:hypothetical protein